MNMQKFIGIGVAAGFMLSAGLAAAQTTTSNGITFTSTPTATAAVSGTGQNLGTITVTNPGTQNATINSIPLSVSSVNGNPSNLTSCQLYNANGAQLGAAYNPTSSANSFSFAPSLVIAPGTTVLTVRCTVANGIPANATYSFYVNGSPVFQTPQNALAVRVDTAPSVPSGSQDVALANISLDATGLSGVTNLSTVPVTVTAGNGASTADLTNCRIEQAVSQIPLSNSYSVVNGAQTSFSLAAPFPTVGGLASMLSLVCDVAPATPVGGTFTIALNPSSFSATNSSGAGVSVSQATGNGADGLPAALSGTVIVSGPTSTTGTGTGTGTSGTGTSGVPGVPNTGAGGMAATMLGIMIAALGVALLGGSYLRTRAN